jgi:hypothetical protein
MKEWQKDLLKRVIIVVVDFAKEKLKKI